MRTLRNRLAEYDAWRWWAKALSAPFLLVFLLAVTGAFWGGVLLTLYAWHWLYQWNEVLIGMLTLVATYVVGYEKGHATGYRAGLRDERRARKARKSAAKALKHGEREEPLAPLSTAPSLQRRIEKPSPD